MGTKFWVVVLLTLYVMLPYTSSKSMSVNEYFPHINREISRVTWAHAVNNHEKLKNAIADDKIMMLEADVVMGHHDRFEDIQPIMAHPPLRLSGLTFIQFLEAVFRATKPEGGKRKGIKLDFKELRAVEPSLKILKSLLEEPDSPAIPIFINADILQGPVNSTREPLDPAKFISLVKKYAPFAVLSVGWTTRYGTDDSSYEIRYGQYSKQQMKEMHQIIRTHAGDPPIFPHITFPVRAGLAAQSIDNLFFLTGRIRTDSSITLWSAPTDPVDREALRDLINQRTGRHCFIDLPFSIEEGQDDETAAEVIKSSDPNLSAIQQLEGRGQPEESVSSAAASSSFSFVSLHTILPVITVGIITAAYIAYRGF